MHKNKKKELGGSFSKEKGFVSELYDINQPPLVT